MKRIRLIASVLVAAAVIVPGEATSSGARSQPTGPPDTYVTDWDAIGTQAFTAAASHTRRGSRDLRLCGYCGLRLGDGDRGRVSTVRGRCRCTGRRLARSSRRRGRASHSRPLPADQAPGILDPAYAASLATIPDGQAKADGVATGEQVAAFVIAERADDGFRAPVTYTPPDPPIPGVWIPTAPTPPIGPYLGLMRPFSLASADQFRPPAPPSSTARNGHETTTRSRRSARARA